MPGNLILDLVLRLAIYIQLLKFAQSGSTKWWPGKTRPKVEIIMSNWIGTHLNMIERIYTCGARIILPEYRIAPHVVFRESGLVLAEIILVSLTEKAAIRTLKLDSYHSLCKRRQVSI